MEQIEILTLIGSGFILQSADLSLSYYEKETDFFVVFEGEERVYDSCWYDTLADLEYTYSEYAKIVAYMHHDAYGTKELFTVGGVVRMYSDPTDWKIESIHAVIPTVDGVYCLLVCTGLVEGEFAQKRVFTGDELRVKSLGLELPMYPDYYVGEADAPK